MLNTLVTNLTNLNLKSSLRINTESWEYVGFFMHQAAGDRYEKKVNTGS